MPKPMSYREFEKFFDRVYQEKRDKRRQATGTLEPGRMDRYLRSGRPLPAEFGTKPDGSAFTKEDLRAFEKRRKQIEKRYGARAGVPVADIWAKTLKIDRVRAQREIRNATLTKIDTKAGQGAALLKFQVTASPQSKFSYHLSQIRLDEWVPSMESVRNPKTAVKQAVGGRISMECDCGRFQYWYRYLIGAMGAGIKPLEKAYPKIRNPRLKGAVCKHLITALANLQSPAVQHQLAMEMRKIRDAVGFGDEHERFIDEGKSDRAARSMRSSRADVRKAYRQYQQGRKAVAQQRKKEAEKARKKMEKEELKRQTRAELDRREAEKAQRDAKAAALQSFIDVMKPAGLSANQLRDGFAASQGMSADDVAKLAADYKVSLG